MTIEFGKWLVEKETAPICRYIKAITHERVKIPHCTRNKVVMLMFASVLDRAPTKVASEADISREKKCSICLGKYIINTLVSILYYSQSPSGRMCQKRHVFEMFEITSFHPFRGLNINLGRRDYHYSIRREILL